MLNLLNNYTSFRAGRLKLITRFINGYNSKKLNFEFNPNTDETRNLEKKIIFFYIILILVQVG